MRIALVQQHATNDKAANIARGLHAFEEAARNGASAIMVGDNPDTMTNRAVIADLIGTASLPAMYALPEFVKAGGLIAYSFDLVELNKRVANDIDAILRGENPGDIPYYQASKFELSLNLKTAKTLGLSLPPALPRAPTP